MSEKREEKKKGIRKHLKFVLEKLHEGIEPAEYRGEKEAIPHTTLNEILQILEKAGTAFVDKKAGKWYYYWKKEKEELLKDYQEFKNKDEYDLKLNHSKNLLKEAGFTEFSIDVLSFMVSHNFGYFLRHLETGYPNIYKLYTEIKKDDSKMEKAFSVLHQKIGEIALASGIKFPKAKMYWLLFSTDANRVVYEEAECFPRLTFVDELNKGIVPEELEDMFKHVGFTRSGDAMVRKEKENEWKVADKRKIIIRKEEGKLNIYEIRDLKKEWQKWLSEEVFVSLRAYIDYFLYEISFRYDAAGCKQRNEDEFIEKCTRSEPIRKSHDELAEISKKTAKDYFELIREIKFIIIKVLEDGEPLRGNCDRCPKITIGRVS